jgi:hypothetical protein
VFDVYCNGSALVNARNCFWVWAKKWPANSLGTRLPFRWLAPEIGKTMPFSILLRPIDMQTCQLNALSSLQFQMITNLLFVMQAEQLESLSVKPKENTNLAS